MSREAPSAGGGGGDASPPSPFVFVRSAGQFWLRDSAPRSPVAEAALRASGFCLGSAVANRCAVPLRLPRALFVKLLDEGSAGSGGCTFSPTLELLREFDPDAAQSVENATRLPDGQFRDMCALEGCPGATRDGARPRAERISRLAVHCFLTAGEARQWPRHLSSTPRSQPQSSPRAPSSTSS